MRTRRAKKALTFNIFLSSLVAPPLSVEFGMLAAIFGIPESILSGLRHGNQKRMPVAFQPELMASRFAFDLLGCFPRSGATVKRFLAYAQTIREKYMVSDALDRYLSVFSDEAALAGDDLAEKFCSGVLPALMSYCYEEAYRNTQSLWPGESRDEPREPADAGAYQEKNRLFLELLCAVGEIRDRPQDYIDISYLERVGNSLFAQIRMPFFRQVARKERVSLSAKRSFLVSRITGEEEFVSPKTGPAEYMIRQTVYHEDGLPEPQVADRAFHRFGCRVDGEPLRDYLEGKEQPGGSAAPAVKIIRTEKCGGIVCSEVKLTFRLYPEEPSRMIRISYAYEAKSRFTGTFPSLFFYFLSYPCEAFFHDLELSPEVSAEWGVCIRMVFPEENTATAGAAPVHPERLREKAYRISFRQWAVPGSGYIIGFYRRSYGSALIGSGAV